MEQEITNFARFYVVLKKLPEADKEALVCQFTDGRTTHLHLMSRKEYELMCDEMERTIEYNGKHDDRPRSIRKKRSSVLHQMQLAGIDTANWHRVDAYCMDKRISGKRFCRLDEDELDALLKKLRAIRRKTNTM